MKPKFPKDQYRLKLITVILFGAFVSSFHFFTPTHIHFLHLIYDRLCYFPVILAAFWFGFWGGALMGLSMSIMHLIHVSLDWGGNFFEANFYQTLESTFHLFIGLVTGFLSERYLRASQKLDQSYHELKEKTIQVLNAEEQLRRTERVQALAELSAGVAHEIRTPLASIKGSAEILANETITPEQRMEFAAILLKESRHLNKVVDEFLNFARTKKPMQVECRIPDLIDDILALTLQQRQSKELNISMDFEPNLPPVYFDNDQLKQVFVNLINNAIQSMPDGGDISIAGKQENSAIICMIEDSGMGIPKHILARIFDPFFTTRQNGTGLGLSIAQKIMNFHDGSIDATNREDGGACFTLRFPRIRSSDHE